MLTIESARDPVWSDAEGNGIVLFVKFAEFNEEHHFNATNFDCMPYGVELYNRAKSGEFGEIGPYVPPVQPNTTGTQNA